MHYSITPGLKKLLPVPLVILIMLLASCIKDNLDFEILSDRISYSPTLLLPLAHGNLTLGNLLEPDDSTVFFDADNTITLVFREDSVFYVTLNEMLALPLPDPIFRTFKTDPVTMDDFSTISSISLGEITNRINEPEASVIKNAEGNTAVFPQVPRQDPGGMATVVLEDLEYVLFAGGELELTARNNLPVEVNMEVRLVNEPGGTEAGRFVYENLGPGESATQGSPLEGVTVMQNMTIEVLGFSTASSGSEVHIDLSDDIELEINSKDLVVIKGRAMIAKTMLDTAGDAMVLNFEEDVELDELNIKEGVVNYAVDNVSGGLTMDVALTNVSRDGNPCGFEIISDGAGGRTEGTYKLLDADIGLDDRVRLVMKYTLYVGSDSNEMVEFDLSRGSTDLDIRFSDFTIGYTSGYLGQGEFDLEIEDFMIDNDLFNKISGDFRITNPSMRIFYENSGGIPSELSLNMTARSADRTRQADLFDEERKNFTIGYPDEPYSSFSGEYLIGSGSSNIIGFASLPPSVFRVNASVLMNPQGPGGAANFITSESSALMGMEFELPLDMQLNSFILTDTMSVGGYQEEIDMIENLYMHMLVTNAFPSGASVSLSLYDSLANRVLYTFEEIAVMDAAGVDERGVVIDGGETLTESEVEIPENVAAQLKQATHIIVRAQFISSKSNGSHQPVKFRTTDRLDFRIRLKAGLSIEK
jgi:hypothetical protein